MDGGILSEEELKLAVQKIFKRSQTDPEFRALCVGDPNEAIRLVSGKTVPLHIKIRFLDFPSDEANEARDGAT